MAVAIFATTTGFEQTVGVSLSTGHKEAKGGFDLIEEWMEEAGGGGQKLQVEVGHGNGAPAIFWRRQPHRKV